jgi:hypothetical protein
MQPKWNVFQTKKSRPPEATQSLYQEQPSFKLFESELKPRIWTSVSHFILRVEEHIFDKEFSKEQRRTCSAPTRISWFKMPQWCFLVNV